MLGAMICISYEQLFAMAYILEFARLWYVLQHCVHVTFIVDPTRVHIVYSVHTFVMGKYGVISFAA